MTVSSVNPPRGVQHKDIGNFAERYANHAITPSKRALRSRGLNNQDAACRQSGNPRALYLQ